MKKLILGCVFAALLAGCQSAPSGNGGEQPKPEPEPEPEPEPQPDPNVVKGQDGKQVIFALGIDGMD